MASTDDAVGWIQVGTFVLGALAVAFTVRLALRRALSADSVRPHYLAGLSAGALLGVTLAAFVSRHVHLDWHPRIVLNVPGTNTGDFWYLGPLFGILGAFAVTLLCRIRATE
jgi:hypothetical protein